MGIFSIGIDMVEIDRIERLINRYGDNFIHRVFTETEIRYCSKRVNKGSFAARFATKEAVFKATGLGLSKGMSWRDVEVVNDENGKPSVRLYGKTAELLARRRIHLSLSHTKTTAVAMVIVE